LLLFRIGIPHDAEFYLTHSSLTLQVTIHAISNGTVYGILLAIALPGCAIKQLVNLVQVESFSDRSVLVFFTSVEYSGWDWQHVAQVTEEIVEKSFNF